MSGVILFDETIRQNASDGARSPKILESQGIIPGIKVDKGAVQAREVAGRDSSPTASTDCASVSSSTASSARASRSGAR